MLGCLADVTSRVFHAAPGSMDCFTEVDLGLAHVAQQLRALDMMLEEHSEFSGEMSQAVARGALALLAVIQPSLDSLQEAVENARAGKPNPLIQLPPETAPTVARTTGR